MLEVGDRVQILKGKSKGKQAEVCEISSTQIRCKIQSVYDNPFYFWYKPENIRLLNEIAEVKESDKWYTPPNIEDLVTQVLGAIDLDPCADDGKHIAAAQHYTATDDGLSQEWHGRVFMNPPYSCPGKWIAKLQAEYESGRVTEAIALVPASTDTNWLSPIIAVQPVCFWKGRIKFLDANYQPKLSARQSHCLVYWGDNQSRFKEVFQQFGVVMNVNSDRWDAADFGEVPYKADGDQLTIYCDINEPPDPDDYTTIPDYEQAWAEWEKKLTRANAKPEVHIIDQFGSLGIIKENLGFGFAVDWLNPGADKNTAYNWERDRDRINTFSIAPQSLIPVTEIKTEEPKAMTVFQFSSTNAIASQIAQLQEQLNALIASQKPLQECEQKADELRREVARYAQEMRNRGVGQDDILSWAKSLHIAASGMEFVEGDNGVIAAQNEAIAQFKFELATVEKREERALVLKNEALMQLSDAARERDEALDKIENITEDKLQIARRLQTTQDRHVQVLEEKQTDTATIEALRKENISLIARIQALEVLTDGMDEQLAEQQLMPEVEVLKQQIFELEAIDQETRLAFRKQLTLLENTTLQRDEARDLLTNLQEKYLQVLQELESFKKQPFSSRGFANGYAQGKPYSDQIVDILKVQEKSSGKQIIESLGMDEKSGRAIYTALNRLLSKGIISCNPDPLDKRQNLYSLNITSHVVSNIQDDTQEISHHVVSNIQNPEVVA